MVDPRTGVVAPASPPAAAGGLPQFDPAQWPGQIVWVLVVFAILYILFARVFVPRLGGAIAEREARIAADIAEARRLKAEAETQAAAAAEERAWPVSRRSNSPWAPSPPPRRWRPADGRRRRGVWRRASPTRRPGSPPPATGRWRMYMRLRPRRPPPSSTGSPGAPAPADEIEAALPRPAGQA